MRVHYFNPFYSNDMRVTVGDKRFRLTEGFFFWAPSSETIASGVTYRQRDVLYGPYVSQLAADLRIEGMKPWQNAQAA